MPHALIFINGQYKRVSENHLKLMTPGLLKGLGVFETLLCDKGKVFFLPAHYRRFLHGCDRYVLPKPPALLQIKGILKELLKENKISEGRIRLAAWRTGWQLHFAVVVIAREGFSEKIYAQGFSAGVYPRRFDRPFQLARVKSLDYMFFLKAYEYALKNKFQEAILMNSSGHIGEGSRSNIFLVKQNKLFTPSLSCGSLAGVTRQVVLDAAKSLRIKTAAGQLSIDELQNCQEAFLTNALIGIMPLTRFGNHKIASGHAGPVTKRLLKSYKKLSQEHSIFVV